MLLLHALGTLVLQSLATMTAWGTPPMRVDRIDSNNDLLRVGFYNVGILQAMLKNLNKRKADKRLDRLATDIADAFENHDLDLLGHLPLVIAAGPLYKMGGPDLTSRSRADV